MSGSIDEQFERFLRENSLSPCKCGRKIDRFDVAWNNACTEAGTDHASVQIQCESCQSEIAQWHTWRPGIESFEDLVENVLDDYEP